jgi:hypothetical protein
MFGLSFWLLALEICEQSFGESGSEAFRLRLSLPNAPQFPFSIRQVLAYPTHLISN